MDRYSHINLSLERAALNALPGIATDKPQVNPSAKPENQTDSKTDDTAYPDRPCLSEDDSEKEENPSSFEPLSGNHKSFENKSLDNQWHKQTHPDKGNSRGEYSQNHNLDNCGKNVFTKRTQFASAHPAGRLFPILYYECQ
jgi:hypothetical protein